MLAATPFASPSGGLSGVGRGSATRRTDSPTKSPRPSPWRWRDSRPCNRDRSIQSGSRRAAEIARTSPAVGSAEDMSLHRDRRFLLERRAQRVPRKARALHPRGELVDPLEHDELSERLLVDRPRGSPRDHLVKLIEERARLFLGLALEGDRHHGRGCLRDRAALALEADLRDALAVHLEEEGDAVATQGARSVRRAVRGLDLVEVARVPAVVKNHVLVQLAQVRHQVRLPPPPPTRRALIR